MGNSNSGRKPKPTALKMLLGNPGQRKLNVNEVKPPHGEVLKPDSLSEPAKKLWDSMAPVCLAMGTLTTGDVRPFAAMCELQATLIEASSQKDAEGFAMFTISHDFDGAPKVGVHAAIKIERETANALRPYYEYFGMTPSSRARISVPKQDEPVSKWAGALK
jgi:P27 family predicted phage terminase small subunit